MAITPALATSYVSLAEANTVNAAEAVWTAASDESKNMALSFARQFIDSKYNCEIFDVTDAPAEIQYANALLAVSYLNGTLFTEAVANVLERDVRAGGGVGVKTKFARSGGTSVVDPFPAITSMIYGYCKLKTKGMSIVGAARS
jgi:hypothetical protein